MGDKMAQVSDDGILREVIDILLTLPRNKLLGVCWFVASMIDKASSPINTDLYMREKNMVRPYTSCPLSPLMMRLGLVPTQTLLIARSALPAMLPFFQKALEVFMNELLTSHIHATSC